MGSTLPSHAAVVPVPKLEDDFYDWYQRHEAKCREAASANHDLIFIGDSITHLFEGDPNWKGRGERIWQRFYGQRRAMNLGYGWDRTQNVLWRLAHGEFAGQTPRLVVLLIGTNNLSATANSASSSPAEIADGIAAICRRIDAASPQSRILVMGVLPRGTPADPIRARILEINRLLEAFAKSQPSITFLDIGARFLDGSGRIPVLLMDDGTHPTEAGYELWAQSIEPVVCEAMGDARVR